jgi:hypothetical protein
MSVVYSLPKRAIADRVVRRGSRREPMVRMSQIQDKAGRVFVLKAIDSTTSSIAQEARFEVTDCAALCSLLEKPFAEFETGAVFELDPADVATLVRHFGLDFETGDMRVELYPWHPNDDLPYQVHTGRELALMLRGIKPLAVFSEVHPSLHGLYIIPELEFEPHVNAGRIIKREEIVPPDRQAPVVRGQRIGTRRVLYVLPGEAWRIDAYILLWRTAEKSGWNEGFERMEGSLLGYEDWQNDIHIERRYRRDASGRQSSNPSTALGASDTKPNPSNDI